MKLDIFSKKNILDERQEQTLCKLESRGFRLLWWGLLAVIIVGTLVIAAFSGWVGGKMLKKQFEKAGITA